MINDWPLYSDVQCEEMVIEKGQWAGSPEDQIRTTETREMRRMQIKVRTARTTGNLVANRKNGDERENAETSRWNRWIEEGNGSFEQIR